MTSLASPCSPRFTVRLHRHRSSREWIVLLPGAGATTSVWSGQVRAFSRHFNLALVDFPGHSRKGRRPPHEVVRQGPYAFESLAVELGTALDRAGLARCHVVALSLGTILARVWAARDPERLQSAVLAGTIADLTPLAYVLMRIGWYARRVMPYMMLYRLYAWIIMPGPAHAAARRLFYRDARTLGRREFNRWFSLSSQVPALLRALRRSRPTVPTLHVMGARDRMFLGGVRRLAAADGSPVHVIADAGHVCTVEAAAAFNTLALDFLRHHGGAAPSAHQGYR